MTPLTHFPLRRALTVMGPAAAIVTLTVALGAQDPVTRPALAPDEIVEMQHHFLDVTVLHEAIIRGDLEAVLAPAARLARLDVPPLTPGSSFVEAIRSAGREIVRTPTLAAASTEVSGMLQQCGSCHKALAVYPAPRTRRSPDLGGLVGHMLEHQRAVDDLLLGLVVPSEGRWRQGADRLWTAPLGPTDWVPSRELTLEVRRAEDEVHQLASVAARATTAIDQAAAYSRVIRTCASCHRLHARVWGPRSQ